VTTPLVPDAIQESPVEETPASSDATETEAEQHTHWEPEPEPGEEPVEATEGFVAPAGEEPPLPAGELTPVTVRVGREHVPIEGAVMAPEGLYVPEASVKRVMDLFQRGIRAERGQGDRAEEQKGWGQTIERERAESVRQTALREVVEAEAGAYTKELEKIFESEEAFLAFAEQYGRNVELLKSRVAMAKNAAVMDVMKRGINLDQPANTVPIEETNKQAAKSLIENFDDIVENSELATLLPEVKEQDAVFAMLLKNPRRYIENAPYDMPEIGVRKGELVVNRENIFNDAKAFAGFRAQPTVPTRADKVNKAVLSAPSRPPVSPRPVRPASPEKPPMTEAQWRRNLRRMARES
jgi:hypothetical protein